MAGTAGPSHTELNDISFDMNFDPDAAQRIRDIAAAKDRAVRSEVTAKEAVKTRGSVGLVVPNECRRIPSSSAHQARTVVCSFVVFSNWRLSWCHVVCNGRSVRTQDKHVVKPSVHYTCRMVGAHCYAVTELVRLVMRTQCTR